MFGILTELQGDYRTRGEHRKADDVKVDMDLYQSRIGKVHQEVGDKLKESAKPTEKHELDKDSFGKFAKVVSRTKLSSFRR